MKSSQNQSEADLYETAANLQRFLEEQNWRFTIIGGIANQAWGENRFTYDVDVTLLTGFSGEQEKVEKILTRYKGRRDDALEFALKARVVLVTDENGVSIDIGLGGFPYEEQAVDRKRLVDYGHGVNLWVISPEDLIIMKSFAGRDRDWIDIRGVIAKQGGALDWDLILPHVRALGELKEDPEMESRLLKIRADEESY